ncbi:hypothetical protein [Streptomyces sp. GESEQ-4]|uniref:hypothetical protein n=1 Tax=Streptomyces sp. GESEQ-4 TaxID=2812655 RepID=UPI001B334395|nr:hypothetical protein [Streptomyces sp. GESEQ-4]
MKQPVDHAREVALRVLLSVTSAAIPEVPDLAEAVRRFEQVEFEVPAGDETDGFLFQYGHANWFPEPTFVLGITRQLGVGEEGSVEEYVQVQFEYQYHYDAELDQLKSPDSWWFRDGVTSFAVWFDSVLRDPVWDVIRKRVPVAFEVTEEVV